MGVGEGGEVVDQFVGDAALGELDGSEAVVAAVDRHTHDQGLAVFQNSHSCGGGAHAGGVEESVLGTLKGGKSGFCLGAGGVTAALVFEGAFCAVGGLAEGGGGVNRGYDGMLFVRVHGVNGASGKACHGDSFRHQEKAYP